jgi:fermentation-respiration switch protein FrsA (DUF1100 family)
LSSYIKFKSPSCSSKVFTGGISAKQDELVPFAHMNRLSDQIKKDGHGNFSEYIIENGTHNNTWELNREEYFREIVKFF